jgi:hypothetical protein
MRILQTQRMLWRWILIRGRRVPCRRGADAVVFHTARIPYADMGRSLLHPPIRSCAHVRRRQNMHPYTHRPSLSPLWPLYAPVLFPKPWCARQFDFYLHRANSTPTRLFIAAGHPVSLTPPLPVSRSFGDWRGRNRPSRKTRLALCIVHLWLVSVTLGSDRILLEAVTLFPIPPAAPVALFPPAPSHTPLLL